MTSFLYNHLTSQWDPVEAGDIAANVYRVPNLPGDEERYMEIPAIKAHDPKVLRTLARFRPPLAEANGNGTVLARPHKSNGSRKRSLYDADAQGLIGTKLDCDQIRSRIMAMIESGIKVSDFTRSLGVSNPSYYRFMGQSGPDKGCGSEVYSEALRYFTKGFAREGGGDDELRSTLPAAPPTKRPRRSASPTSSADSSVVLPTLPRASISHSFSSATSAPPVTINPLFSPLPDTAGIILDNELTDSYASSLSCDQIRTLISQYFESTKETQASFLRTLMAQYHTEDKKIQSVQLQRFRGMRGDVAGSTNPVFYAAGVFFEKVRRAKERETEKKEKGDM